jgi:saccharopine dehydrogenase (NAD+, L-lysine forming)
MLTDQLTLLSIPLRPLCDVGISTCKHTHNPQDTKKVSDILIIYLPKALNFDFFIVLTNPMKIGIIREGKTPPDARTPLVPEQCAYLIREKHLDIIAEPSPIRCYANAEYEDFHVPVSHDLHRCDVLMGIKEVPVDQLIADKTYLFFSHTIKEQPYNRKLLQAVLQKNIRLLDYEVMTDDLGRRLIAFGKFAGMVGAHNALWTWGQRTGAFTLPRMKDCFDYEAAKEHYFHTSWPAVKIVVTGSGRVGTGAVEVLHDMGILQVSPDEFLNNDFDEAVFTQVTPHEYVARKDGAPFHTRDYYQHPEQYQSAFGPFTRCTDIFINGIYWDSKAPAFFTADDMKSPDFRIRVIADVTCDIAPVSSVPSTIRPSSIANPVYGYDPESGTESAPHQANIIDVMAIDNLPSEMPRDASRAFGDMFINHILHEMMKPDSSVIERATIAKNGQLGKHFQYLSGYAGLVDK